MAKPDQLATAPNPLGDWFDALIAVLGAAAVAANRGRCAQIAKLMKAAGIDPFKFPAAYRAAHARYAPKLPIDVGTLTKFWCWVVVPPSYAALTPHELQAMSKSLNGGEYPF